MRLDGKVAIVTGAGRGIGYAYAERFIREGAKVVIAELREDRAADAATALAALGEVHVVATDVASESSTEAAAKAAAEHFGGIDILVNNAAIYGDWNPADQSLEYLRRVMDVNLTGVWLMSKAVAPFMVDRGGGRIINQSSGAAYNYAPSVAETFTGLNSYNYSMSKWGVVGLTKYMAAQLGQWSITVNCIAPGVIDTEATRAVVDSSILAMLAQRQAVRGQLGPEHLTGAAVFFATDEAAFITGQVLVVDGGKHMPA
jgi:3-oxoacyl-[acyl-carrier protein] reductase